MPEPLYMETWRSGLLKGKAESALTSLASCRLCPRACGKNRLAGERGVCFTGRRARVSSFQPHFGEEDVLRGWGGSGTIFFSYCSLGCRFCQNWEISHGGEGQEVPAQVLAAMALKLQALGCHNLNLVTPSHVVPHILEALLIAVAQGFRLPIVYNTSAYDTPESLKLLDGVADIYMPDFKFWDEGLSRKYLTAEDYPERAREAIVEMHRQTGVLEIDPKTGLAKRGILLRHLVMPGCLEDSRKIFRWIAKEVSPDTYVNVMDQYHPAGEMTAEEAGSELGRCLSREEHRQALAIAKEEGLRRFT